MNSDAGPPAGEWEKPPPETQNCCRKWCFSRAVKNYTCLGNWRDNAQKINSLLRVYCVNLKILSKISNLNCSLAQTREFPMDFLISFRIIKDFQYPIKIKLIIIKISFSSFSALIIRENISNNSRFSFIYRQIFNKFSSFRGSNHLENAYS